MNLTPDEQVGHILLSDYKRAVEERKRAEKVEAGLYAKLFAATLSGQETGCTIKQSTSYKVSDRVALWKYIHETGAVDLLQARLTNSAVEARLAEGKTIPGVNVELVDKLEI
jgi:hypothetical protein